MIKETSLLEGEKINDCADVLTAKALALRFGLTLEQRIGCDCLVINSDNLEVIETKMSGHYLGAVAAIFNDCYHLACDFTIARFEHCSRDANKVAHELSRLAGFSLTLDWFEEPPIEIVPLLINDVTVFFQ